MSSNNNKKIMFLQKVTLLCLLSLFPPQKVKEIREASPFSKTAEVEWKVCNAVSTILCLLT